MLIAAPIRTKSLRFLSVVCLAAGSTALFSTGCGSAPGAGMGEETDTETPKEVRVRFDTFDVGSDDCEDLFSYGDFNVRMRLIVQPSNEEVFAVNRGVSLGSAAFQAEVQSVDLDETADFVLEPGETFEIEIRVTEDDPINSDEPQPWDEAESFDHLTVASQSLSFTNGPGCFRDDRVDVTVTVGE